MIIPDNWLLLTTYEEVLSYIIDVIVCSLRLQQERIE